jgi:anti-anti-sigma regulatory factor
LSGPEHLILYHFLSESAAKKLVFFTSTFTFMAISYQPLVPQKQQGASISSIDLDAVDVKHVAYFLAQHTAPRPHVAVDCSTLKCLRTLGVSHVVSQLLVLHQSGASIWLLNVDPVLKRCLRLLRLEPLFLFAD